MRFAHLADTHLGYRQYNLSEREEDFYASFREAVEKIIAADCDFVIHSGDLFDEPRPHIRAMMEVGEAIDRFEEAGIEVFAVTGNHDRMIRRGSYPPHALYKRMNLLTPESPWREYKGMLICGLPYIPKGYSNVLKEKLGELAEKARGYEKSIIVLHQAVDKYLGFEGAYELKIGELPRDFNYYAMGHVHFRRIDVFGRGKLAYPGSLDVWRADELEEYEKNGKGFYLVDAEDLSVEKVDLEGIRPFVSAAMKSAEDIAGIKARIGGPRKPVLRVVVEASSSEYPWLYQSLSKDFRGLVLHLDVKRKIVEEIVAEPRRGISTRDMLSEDMKEYREEEIEFASEILDALSVKDIEKARAIAGEFYGKWSMRRGGEHIEEKPADSRVQSDQKGAGAPVGQSSLEGFL